MKNLLKSWFPVGTRSLLFGVHQFLWHPLTVAIAWRRLYGQWPGWIECVCIFCHDLGYWGSPDMDGDRGKAHPIRGGFIAGAIVRRTMSALLWFLLPFGLLVQYKTLPQIWRRYRHDWGFFFFQIRGRFHSISLHAGVEAFFLVRHHSRSLAKAENAPVSPLCDPDKFSILCEPLWFYLLRARISGEGREFARNAAHLIGEQPACIWARWYRNRVKAVYDDKESNRHLVHYDPDRR